VSTTVLLVDDHELIRQGLRRAFERSADFEVVGEAGSIAEAFRKLEALTPQVVVVDVRLPDGSGLELVREVRKRRSEVQGLVAQAEQILPDIKALAAAKMIGADVVARMERLLKEARQAAGGKERSELAGAADELAKTVTALKAVVVGLRKSS